MLHSIRDDLYLIVGIDQPADQGRELPDPREPARRLDLVRVHRPHLRQRRLHVAAARAGRVARVGSCARAAAVAASVMLGIILALMPVPAFAQGSSSHAGVVEHRNDKERDVFKSLRCMCGACAATCLSTTARAETSRRSARRSAAQIAAGMSKERDPRRSTQERWGQDGARRSSEPGRPAGDLHLCPSTAIVARGVGLAAHAAALATASARDGDRRRRRPVATADRARRVRRAPRRGAEGPR